MILVFLQKVKYSLKEECSVLKIVKLITLVTKSLVADTSARCKKRYN